MLIRRGFLPTLIPISALILAPSSAHAQALGEYAGVNAGVAGMGAGVAASMHNGVLVRRTYQSAAQAQQALVAQNNAVAQYLKLGAQFESKKQWDNAEKAFTYVLQVIARRDGPGSPQGLPALKHLAEICKAQNKIDQAISFQKTVVAFTKADKKTEPQVLIKEQECLSNLFIAKSDYASAEPVLRNTVNLYQQAAPSSRSYSSSSSPSFSTASSSSSPNNYTRTLRVYGTVLRQLNKTDEASQIESQLTEQQQTAAAPSSSTDANGLPLFDSSKNPNTTNTPSVANAEATPNNGSATDSAVATAPEKVTTSDRIGQNNTIATAPPSPTSTSTQPSVNAPPKVGDDAQAPIIPGPSDSDPTTSLLPDPSSLSFPEPELIPMPTPMPDGTTQEAH